MASKGKAKELPWYASGIGASVASMATHPLDLSKVRLQVATQKSQCVGNLLHSLFSTAHSGLFRTLIDSVRSNGLRRGAYTGLSASVMRQATYSSARFGSYPPLLALLRKGDEKPGFGNPADIVLVRMTADTIKPPDKRYSYRNCFHGVYRISVDEGLGAFFRGLAPNSGRAILMNASQISTYGTFKDFVLANRALKLQDGLLVHTLSSTLAGTVATMCCSPFDVLKSRIMNAKGSETMLQVIRQSFERDGIAWMFRGFVPAWLRLTPQTVITFVVLERARPPSTQVPILTERTEIRHIYTGHY